MNLYIDCYGPASRWCGAERLTLELPSGARVTDALDHLAARYPEFAARRASIAVAIDDTVVPNNAALSEGDRLALIPPVSGG
ncbi:MAG: MoaD/ThiS family protein [Nevskia sp.]|nr:MoaD/ThiS family protein [Nevskia sp.]